MLPSINSGLERVESTRCPQVESLQGISVFLPFASERRSRVPYSGCQKNVPVFKRFFLQTLMPQFRISEYNYAKRYKIVERCCSKTGGYGLPI